MNDVVSLLEKGWPYLVVATPGVFAVVKQVLDARRIKAAGRREERRDEQQLIKIAHEVATAAIEGLRKRLADVEAKLSALRKEHSEMMAHKDARIQLLEGEKRNLQMTLLAYEDLLRRHGIELPVQSQPYWEFSDNEMRQAAPDPQ